MIAMLCAVKLRVLGLKAYWYTGSALHQISQSYYFTTQPYHNTIIQQDLGFTHA